MELEMIPTAGGSSGISGWGISTASKDLKREEAGKIRDLELTLYKKEMLLTK